MYVKIVLLNKSHQKVDTWDSTMNDPFKRRCFQTTKPNTIDEIEVKPAPHWRQESNEGHTILHYKGERVRISPKGAILLSHHQPSSWAMSSLWTHNSFFVCSRRAFQYRYQVCTPHGCTTSYTYRGRYLVTCVVYIQYIYMYTIHREVR